MALSSNATLLTSVGSRGFYLMHDAVTTTDWSKAARMRTMCVSDWRKSNFTDFPRSLPMPT